MTDTPLVGGSASVECDEAELERRILVEIGAASTEAALDIVRVGALGKKGSVSALLATLGRMAPDERKRKGEGFNALKRKIAAALETRGGILRAEARALRLATETVDVSLPVRREPVAAGRVHPISQVTEEITAIFADMGFSVAEGPDIETDFYNFTALNFPPGHPARDMHDTFFFHEKDGERRLLRTHTSPVQIRTMLANAPPIRVICPGRTYRCDSDQTHTPMFHQIEGLVIDDRANLANLKWVLQEFCRAFFEADVRWLEHYGFRPLDVPTLAGGLSG